MGQGQLTKAPVEVDQLGVDRQRSARARRLDVGLRLSEQLGVAGGFDVGHGELSGSNGQRDVRPGERSAVS